MDVKQSTQEATDPFILANVYFSYAEDLSKSTSIKEKLASALIYSALAEFLCEELIINIISKIDIQNSQYKVSFNPKTLVKNSNTNLEGALKRLSVLNYPDKEKIEAEIELIKNSRNKIFHNLIRAAEKKIKLDLEITIIQDHTPLLRNLITQSLVKTLGK